MRIPEIADSIRSIAFDPRIPSDVQQKLRLCAAEMGRRQNGERRRPQSATMTPELAQAIREYHAKNQHLTQSAIARHFNVNPGRVSEALHGKRT
jgi:hypothetical protein